MMIKWLPIIFGCHCKPDRSFHFHSKQFPLCARCTGEFLGIVLGLATFFIWQPHFYILIALLFPLIIDGSIQMFTSYVSNNSKRLITGILFGYAFMELFAISIIKVFEFGVNFSYYFIN